ncbi:hypothetical protein BUALT_Bualt01G0195900 [Buddleja alternifolia]|uniref:VASt domain-containing protein n=1 Tax=Buddleja alternifolia TaxID=168488 RepID=A0AAV6YH00_9LAMI|nr:hypothetical protein BUALT_Bualt01G0195900 [Buddleja alternifolia]
MAAMVSEKMVNPTPTSGPPISQSMDGYDSPQRSSGESPTSSPAVDATDRSFSSTPSPSRQLDSQSQPPSRVEEYRQLFRLPPDEALIQDFNCALQENFLLQGHMYLFDHYICFYSNLFGFETKKIIPFHEVTSVKRAKAVAVFPTAIEIMAGGKKYFFTSFLFRDDAFKLISEGWVRHSDGSKEITEQQETKSDISSQENGISIIEESGDSRQSLDELDATESDKNGPILEDPKPLGDGELVSTSSSMQVRGEENAGAAPIIECSSAEKSSLWEPEDADAPGVPECFSKVAETRFPIGVEEFFYLFFSDDGVNFHESFHRKCGDKDFKCTKWHPHEKFVHTRDVSFQHPIKIYFGARFGSCQEVQKYRVYRNRQVPIIGNSYLFDVDDNCSCHLIVDTSQEINDVPYGDYFTVEGRWDVENVGNDSKPCCNLRVYTTVAFSKKTMWKGLSLQFFVLSRQAFLSLCTKWYLSPENSVPMKWGISSNVKFSRLPWLLPAHLFTCYVYFWSVEVSSSIWKSCNMKLVRVLIKWYFCREDSAVYSRRVSRSICTLDRSCILLVFSGIALEFYVSQLSAFKRLDEIIFQAHEVLKQKNLEKEEGSTSNLISNEQVQLEKQEKTQQCMELKAHDARISQVLPDVQNVNQRVDPPQEYINEASVGSLLRATFSKFSTSLKYQSTPSILLVVTIAVILALMQISILVLLSRPQRIHVISQSGFMSGMNENRAEAVATLNKQIKYLKEEMHFVGTLLEKMQYEHEQLKGKLKELELFRNQRI